MIEFFDLVMEYNDWDGWAVMEELLETQLVMLRARRDNENEKEYSEMSVYAKFKEEAKEFIIQLWDIVEKSTGFDYYHSDFIGELDDWFKKQYG